MCESGNHEQYSCQFCTSNGPHLYVLELSIFRYQTTVMCTARSRGPRQGHFPTHHQLQGCPPRKQRFQRSSRDLLNRMYHRTNALMAPVIFVIHNVPIQCSRIPISRHPGRVIFDPGTVHFDIFCIDLNAGKVDF